jgi:putative ABC transport system permease protein
MNLKMAWRNVWRNKRRTLITTASVFIAVILALIMRSAQLGAYQRMIANVVSFYSGHIQIHEKGYRDEQTIDNSFILSDSLLSVLNNSPDIKNWSPRLESFALLSVRNLTKGAAIVGIDPFKENKLTHLQEKISSGKYLAPDDDGVLVAEGLAEYLTLKPGDTIVMIVQGYHGMSAAGKYPIKGLIKFPAPELNQSMVYMSLKESQFFSGTGNRFTSIAIIIPANKDAIKVSAEIRNSLNPNTFEVLDWEEMMPEMVQLIAVDNAGGIITISILYMIITFGIFGTILMMITERKHEFGILIAIGMKKIKLAWVVVLETIMIASLGVVLGALVGLPVIAYFHRNPIHVSGDLATTYERFGMEPVFPFSNDPTIFISQAGVVLAISLLLSIYPLLRILNLKTINALRD